MRSFAIAAVVLLASIGTAEAAPGDDVYAHPGRIVSAGDGARLNLVCMGHGSPAVVFDSGWEDWAPVWTIVQPQVAKWTRACSYDRAGAGFSEAGPMPRTSARIATELHTALHNAGVAGPYILVGHAFGGDNVRAFADLFMPDVAGLVLVEADPTELMSQERQDRDHKGHADLPVELRACRDAIAGHKPLPPLAKGSTRSCAQQFFRGLPEAQWSPELNAKLMEIASTKLAMYDAYASEMEETARDEDFLTKNARSLCKRPLRVLTTGYHAHGFFDPKRVWNAEELAYERDIQAAQARWLALSTNAKQLFTHKSSEYVPFDDPGFVVAAIREVYDQSGKR
jgi:pimeloyl-ACP methyl ester carboxylesterase